VFEKVTIIGDGAMGTVLAMLLCEKGISVRMWGHDADHLRQMQDRRRNVKFFPDYDLPPALVLEPADDLAMEGADLIVSAVPCQFIRLAWTRLKPYTPAGVPILSVAKGIENGTLLRPTQILADVLGRSDHDGFCVLSGPTIADELARRLPATACAASSDEALALSLIHI